jgi:hypothetical protein
MHKILKTLSMVALSLLIGAGVSYSATTGKIQGVVRDAQTGEALPGANVVIDGTQRGAVTDSDGFFLILLVDPGTYSMTASIVGYDAQRQTDIRVQTDLTSTVDFQIREATLELGEITVIAERPLVEPDKTTSKYIMSAEDLEAVPIVRDMGEFIELQAGVSIDADGNEIMIRGGDRQDVAYVVDGVRITTTDHAGSRTGIGRSLNKSAVQELQVITGGYNAEYGNAQGGVVSMVTRDGGSAYSGSADYQFTPSGQKHWGANVYDSPMHRGNNKWDDPDWVAQQVEIPADLDGDGANDVVQAHKRLDYTGALGHRIDANIAGPLSQDLTFFASTVWRKQPAALLDANLTTPPNTRNTAKLTLGASPSLKLRAGGIYNRGEGTFGGPSQGGRLDLRDSGRNIFLHVVNPTGNHVTTDALFYGAVTHSLSPKTFYEVNFAYSTTTRDTTGQNRHFSVDEELTSSSTKDGAGHYTIYREATNWNMYGYKRLSFKADLSSQVNKQNFVKAGVEVIRYNNWYQNRYSSGPTHRSVRWFSKSYTETAFWPNKDNVGLNPIDFGVYLQDKIEFEGMIVNAGVRGEIFFQNTWLKDTDAWYGLKAPWNGMTRSAVVPEVKGPPIKAFQPRVGVSHPITEKSLVRFFYGRFVQRPQFHEMFYVHFTSNEALDNDLNGNGAIDPAEQYNEYNDSGSRHGTPYLPPEETTSFEVGLDWNFVGDYVLGLTTYYKASGNETIGASQQWRDPETYQYVTGVQGYAPGNWRDVRGFEINLRKKFSNMFSFNVGYNLQWADGGRNSAHRRDVWPDSQFVANGYYWVDWDVDPTTGAEIPVTLREKARRDGLAEDFYVIKFGEFADNYLQSLHRSVTSGSSWSWIPWYSHYSAQGAQMIATEPRTDLGEYDDADREYWERAGNHPGNPGSGEGTLLVGHNQESGERAPLTADRRSYGSITFLFATPANYGPFGGKALGNVRSNLVYRLYTGNKFTYSTGGIQGFRYGPIHTRADFNAEKVFGATSGVNMTLAIEVYNLFNQKDNRQNALSGRAVNFNSDRYQQYGMQGLEPTNPDIVAFNLASPETNDIGNYWDSPRELNFSLRIRW